MKYNHILSSLPVYCSQSGFRTIETSIIFYKSPILKHLTSDFQMFLIVCSPDLLSKMFPLSLTSEFHWMIYSEMLVPAGKTMWVKFACETGDKYLSQQPSTLQNSCLYCTQSN